jgi:hypothetical protein
MSRPTKVTLQIKQAVTEPALQQPNFADLQISACKTIVPPAYASVMRTLVTSDDDVDQLLIELAERYGRRWKLISQQLNGFTESEYKNRWVFLANLKRPRYSRTVTYEI